MRDARLVGRSAELRELEAALTAGSGTGAVVLVGEPGIGKTRMLTELRNKAVSWGWQTTHGQATEYEVDLPYAVVAEALDALLRRRADGLARLPRELRDGLSVVLSGSAGGPGDDGPGRHRAFAAVRHLLGATSTSAPLLVLLDDLHWADDGTVELLSYLLRHPPDGRVVLALSYRPHQVPGRLVLAADAAEVAGRARLVQLGPLSEQDSARLLDPVTSSTDARRLHRTSGGNPLFLTALVRGLGAATLDDALSSDHGPGQLPLPRDVAAAVGADLAAASPTAQQVAHAAAVLGAVFDPDLLAPVADLDSAAVHAALDELSVRDVIRPDSTPGRLAFRHPLLRHVVYEGAGAGWRRTAHARAARLLRDLGEPNVLWAHHVERSADVGDTAAAMLLVRAAIAVRRRAPATSAAWLSAVLRLQPQEEVPGASRGHLRLMIAEALAAAGQLPASRVTHAQAIEELARARPWLRRRAVVSAALVDQLLGRYEDAAALLRRELPATLEADGTEGPESAGLLLEIASVQLMRGDFAAGRVTADRALAALAGMPTGPQRAAAGGIIGLAQYAAGDVEAARSTAEAVGALVDSLTDAELASQLRAAMWLGWTDSFLGRYPEALRHQDRALTVARGSGRSDVLVHLLVGQGGALRWVGRLVEARQCYDEALEVARLSGSDELLTMALSMQCRILTWLGEVEAAVRTGDEAVETARQSSGWFSSLAAVILAQARLEAGRPDGCVATILEAAGGPELPQLELGSHADWYELLTRASLAEGAAPQAATWARQAVAAAEASGLPVGRAFAALASAQVQVDADPAAAAVAALRAVDGFDAAGNPLDAGRARLVAGRALAARGRPDEARTVLLRAQEDFTRCSSSRLQGVAVREVRELARRLVLVPAAASKGLAALSPREAEVAALVAQGRTNREIAAALLLSDKTVERHLGHIFVKLGITSRASLAALVASGGLT